MKFILNFNELNIYFVIIVSFLISFIWINYFKNIDLFEKEKLIHIIFTFIIGSIIPFSIYIIHDYIYKPLGINDSDDFVISFFYNFLGIGLLEEIIKLIPVVITLVVFKKAINEPLDYVKYIGVSALGFAFGENIEYATNYGQNVLLGRAILSVPGHLFFSAIFIYGYVEYKYLNKSYKRIILYMLLGALAHGIYDYLLGFELMVLGKILHFLFFMLIISVFITILNNCVNMSPFYNSKKVINQDKVRNYLLRLYIITLFLIFVITLIYQGFAVALGSYFYLMLVNGTILVLLIVRLSRFNIRPNYCEPIKLEFPVRLANKTNRNDLGILYGLFVIRGESYNSFKISSLIEEEIKVIPLSKFNSYLNRNYLGIIEQKIFQESEVIYVLKLFLDDTKNNFKIFHLIPKTDGKTHNPDGHPFASLNSIDLEKNNKLKFHEWVILKKINV